MNRYSTDTLANGHKVALVNGLYVHDSNGQIREWSNHKECFAWVEEQLDVERRVMRQRETKKTLMEKIKGLLH